MKNILTPIDFSKHSIFALKAAAKIAKKYNYTITMVHMLELPNGYLTNSGGNTHSTIFMLKRANEKFNELIKEDYLEGIIVNVIIKHYAVFDELAELAKENNSSLIVMGSHGKENEEKSYLGSNTEHVVKKANVPVLVIKSEITDINFENSLFVSDFKMECAEAYKKLKIFFDEIGVAPKMLFVNIPNDGFVSSKDMDDRFKDFLIKAEGNLKNIKNFINYDDYSVEKGVINYTKENHTSLISVATHGVSGFASLFHHSVSLELANKSKLPILTALI